MDRRQKQRRWERQNEEVRQESVYVESPGRMESVKLERKISTGKHHNTKVIAPMYWVTVVGTTNHSSTKMTAQRHRLHWKARPTTPTH